MKSRLEDQRDQLESDGHYFKIKKLNSVKNSYNK